MGALLIDLYVQLVEKSKKDRVLTMKFTKNLFVNFAVLIQFIFASWMLITSMEIEKTTIQKICRHCVPIVIG